MRDIFLERKQIFEVIKISKQISQLHRKYFINQRRTESVKKEHSEEEPGWEWEGR